MENICKMLVQDISFKTMSFLAEGEVDQILQLNWGRYGHETSRFLVAMVFKKLILILSFKQFHVYLLFLVDVWEDYPMAQIPHV